MRNWRDLNRKASAVVHQQFQLPAVYLSHAGGTPIPVRVRLHLKTDQSQPSGGDWSDGASVLDLSDSIIFDAAAVHGVVLTSAHVIFSATEGYNTGPSWPARRGYIKTDVTPMSARELEMLLAAVDLTDTAWLHIFPAPI